MTFCSSLVSDANSLSRACLISSGMAIKEELRTSEVVDMDQWSSGSLGNRGSFTCTVHARLFSLHFCIGHLDQVEKQQQKLVQSDPATFNMLSFFGAADITKKGGKREGDVNHIPIK